MSEVKSPRPVTWNVHVCSSEDFNFIPVQVLEIDEDGTRRAYVNHLGENRNYF